MRLYRVIIRHDLVTENVVVWARSSDESFDQAVLVLHLDWDKVISMKTEEVQ